MAHPQLQWTTTSQVSTAQGVKMLVYGGSGDGKTVLCATAPKPVILSAESGLLSLSRRNLERLYGVNNPTITYDIPVIQIRSVADLSAAFSMFANDPSARNHCSTICLDSVTEIAEQVLVNAKALVKDPRQAYGELTTHMMATVKGFRDIPGYHVYMSAKMAPEKDASGVTRFAPMMPGQQVGPQLPYLFDEVFRLGTNKLTDGSKYRFLQTDGDMQYIAKDRSGRLDEVERPDLTHIINKILGA